MIFDKNGTPIEQTGTGLNKADGFGNICSEGHTETVVCPMCGGWVIRSLDFVSTNPTEHNCPKCGHPLGVW